MVKKVEGWFWFVNDEYLSELEETRSIKMDESKVNSKVKDVVVRGGVSGNTRAFSKAKA